VEEDVFGHLVVVKAPLVLDQDWMMVIVVLTLKDLLDLLDCSGYGEVA
jgi:hypothetical protein